MMFNACIHKIITERFIVSTVTMKLKNRFRQNIRVYNHLFAFTLNSEK